MGSSISNDIKDYINSKRGPISDSDRVYAYEHLRYSLNYELVRNPYKTRFNTKADQVIYEVSRKILEERRLRR